MNELKLPQDQKKRQKAIEQILQELFKKTKSKSFIELDKSRFFKKLIDFYKKWPKNKVIIVRWGKIYDPIKFLTEIEKEQININRILRHLELTKKMKRHLRFLADIVTDSYILSEADIEDFDSIIENIKEQKAKLPDIYLLEGDDEPYNSDRIIKELNELTYNAKIYFLRQLKDVYYKKNKDWELAKKLEYELNKKGEPYNVEIYIIGFVTIAENCYIIKIQIASNVYLFEFEGSIEELKESLEKEIESIGQDEVECPFCKKLYNRHYIVDNPKCSCGAEFVTDAVFYMGERDRSFEIEYLWDEACKQTRLKKPKDWYYRHIDDYFENIHYLGKGTVGRRTWALKRPWIIKKKRRKTNKRSQI